MIVDLFAGPGGWEVALDLLGVDDEVVGIEWDPAACDTRAAAGHRTIRADVAEYPTEPFAGRVDGIIGSPPCQAFSVAGKGEGREDVPAIVDAVRDLVDGRDTRAARRAECGDPRSILVVEPVRWVRDLRPTWIALEQVPPVAELWRAYAEVFRSWGYSTWSGVVNAADFGVPQTRKRAVLLASNAIPVVPPAATHAATPTASLFGPELAQWVTGAAALGWDTPLPGAAWAWNRPATTVASVDRIAWPGYRLPGDRPQFDGLLDSSLLRRGGNWMHARPATVVAGDARISPPIHHGDGTQGKNAITSSMAAALDDGGNAEPVAIRLSLAERLVLQSFPADYPVRGSKTERDLQVGNAVPPVLAAHLLAAVIGLERAVAA